MLAGLLADHPSELRADFQHYYGLNLDGMGTDYTFAHAAALAANLPPESATLRAQDVWSERDWMLWSIEFNLRALRWELRGNENVPKPQPLMTPEDRKRVRDKMAATDMQRIAERLGINLEGGVTNG